MRQWRPFANDDEAMTTKVCNEPNCNRGFPKLNLSRIELIEPIWMALGLININSCVTSKLPIIKNYLPYNNGISCRNFLMYIVNKYQCNLFTMCSFLNNLFTVTGNNNTVYSKNRIGNRNVRSKLPIIVF